jgi:hypothetical protein
MSNSRIGGTNVIFSHGWHLCRFLAMVDKTYVMVGQMSCGTDVGGTNVSGTNVGGTNVSGTNVGGTKVAPPKIWQTHHGPSPWIFKPCVSMNRSIHLLSFILPGLISCSG